MLTAAPPDPDPAIDIIGAITRYGVPILMLTGLLALALYIAYEARITARERQRTLAALRHHHTALAARDADDTLTAAREINAGGVTFEELVARAEAEADPDNGHHAIGAQFEAFLAARDVHMNRPPRTQP